MQLLAGLADQLDQPMLDVHVDVFKARPPCEVAGIDLRLHLHKPSQNLLHLRAGQRPHLAQHTAVGCGAADVLPVEALVKGNRSRERLHKGVRVLQQAAMQQFGLVAH